SEGTSWKVDEVAPGASVGGTSAEATAVAVGSDGQPMVAFGDGGATKLARMGGSGGSGWSIQPVQGNGGFGVSMALDQKGNPHLAYYDSGGGVHDAQLSAGGSWSVTNVGQAASSGGPSDSWATRIAVDPSGNDAVVRPDTSPS